MLSDISGGSARVLPNHCLVELPDLQPEGFTVISLIRCAAACAHDSECEAFNYLRHGEVPTSSSPSSSSSSSSRSPGTCHKLYVKSLSESYVMTEVDGCSFYELN